MLYWCLPHCNDICLFSLFLYNNQHFAPQNFLWRQQFGKKWIRTSRVEIIRTKNQDFFTSMPYERCKRASRRNLVAQVCCALSIELWTVYPLNPLFYRYKFTEGLSLWVCHRKAFHNLARKIYPCLFINLIILRPNVTNKMFWNLTIMVCGSNHLFFYLHLRFKILVFVLFSP